MGFFSSKSSSDSGAWQASTRKAPRDSAGAGTHRAHVNGDQLGDYPTRGAARRAARAEARRREAADE
jgi:hypothetical protein